MRGLFVAMLIAGCSTSEPRSHPDRAPVQKPAVAQPAPAPASPPVPAVARDDGSAGDAGHLDDAGAPRPPTSSPPVRAGHPIEIILRSTPTGAQVAVDGIVLGATPAYWSGQADGHEHEFTFVLPRHAIARYRFVPITTGTIHARLQPIGEDLDAGVPAELVPPAVGPPPAPPIPDGPLVVPDAVPLP